MKTVTRLAPTALAVTLIWPAPPASAAAATTPIRPVRDIAFATSTWGIVAASRQILVTTDGGASWYAPAIPETTALLRGAASSPANPALTVVVGESGTLYRTTNGGRTWTRHSTKLTDTLRAVAWVDSGKVVAVGGAYDTGLRKTVGVVWRSTDAGRTWTRTLKADMPSLNSVSFGESGGIAGGYGWVMRSSDGGATWIKNAQPTYGYNNDLIHFGGRVWAFGSPNTNIGKTIVAWSTDGFATAAGGGYAQMSPMVYLVRGAMGPGFAWAVGNSGVNGYEGSGAVFRSSDPGASWTPVTTPAMSVEAIGASGAGHAVLAGSNATGRGLWLTTDGGSSWTLESTAIAGVPPCVTLSTPALSVTTPKKGVAFIISGKATPKHPGSVKLAFHRKSSGSYKPYMTVTRTLSQKSTHSAYSYPAKLPAGYWYVKATSTGTANLLPGFSNARYFTVK